MINTIDVRTSADLILMLERGALDRWGKGDPSGFLELCADDITYFDPVTAARIDGRQAMVNYYRPWVGKIQVARYEMLNPQVVVDGNMALLTYNLVNYISLGRLCRREIHLFLDNTRYSAVGTLQAQSETGGESRAGKHSHDYDGEESFAGLQWNNTRRGKCVC